MTKLYSNALKSDSTLFFSISLFESILLQQHYYIILYDDRDAILFYSGWFQKTFLLPVRRFDMRAIMTIARTWSIPATCYVCFSYFPL